MNTHRVVALAVMITLTLALIVAVWLQRRAADSAEVEDAPRISAAVLSVSDTSRSVAPAAPTGDEGPVLAAMPFRPAAAEGLAHGCWARLYDKLNFTGDTLTLLGPVDMPNARLPSSLEWGRGYDSIVVGPRAAIVVYDRENFRQLAARFERGQRVADLDPELGFFGRIGSLRVTCL